MGGGCGRAGEPVAYGVPALEVVAGVGEVHGELAAVGGEPHVPCCAEELVVEGSVPCMRAETAMELVSLPLVGRAFS